MSTTADFIAELVRVTNKVGKLAPLEKERLLQRSIFVIRDGRDQVGIPRTKTAADPVIGFSQLRPQSIDVRTMMWRRRCSMRLT